MELTQLEYFLTVARLEHMTSASKALRITQPALSHAISKLESELGVPLFERKGRNVQAQPLWGYVQFAGRRSAAQYREWGAGD